MGLAPNIKKTPFKLKQCSKCQQTFGIDNFARSNSFFFQDGRLPICNDCIDNYIEDNNDDWQIVDKICQCANIPFIPNEWEKIKEMDKSHAFGRYANIFTTNEYDRIGWGDYYQEFKRLQQIGKLDEELPLISEDKRNKLKSKWGKNYDDEALNYLENLFNGLLATQNVNGSLQIDQAIKLCKMSYEIDRKISGGEDFDKLLSSYDKLVKAANFTPQNVKNINDFDTCGELIKWLEKRGWKNAYYDNVPRDIVDETIANIQSFNQRLYTNENGIGEEITSRIEALKSVEKLENGNYYDTGSAITDFDNYDNDGYEKLMKYSEKFKIDLNDEEEE